MFSPKALALAAFALVRAAYNALDFVVRVALLAVGPPLIVVVQKLVFGFLPFLVAEAAPLKTLYLSEL